MSKEKIIIMAMARALFLHAHSQDGSEDDIVPIISFDKAWMDNAPATPQNAICAAYRLTGKLEQANDAHLMVLLNAARQTDVEAQGQATDQYLNDFGFCLAMEALGNCYPLSFDEKAFDLKGKKLIIPTIFFFLNDE